MNGVVPVLTYDGDADSDKEKSVLDDFRAAARVALSLKRTYAQRYDTPYKKRPMFALRGLVVQMSDLVTLVAMGFRLGISPKIDLLFNLEQRATIRGGLAALKRAGIPGYDRVHVDLLRSATFQTEATDRELYELVDGKDLGDGVTKIRKIIKRYNLGEAAFALRAQYILDDRDGFRNAQYIAEAIIGAVTSGASTGVSVALGVLKAAFKTFMADPFIAQVEEAIPAGLAKVKMPPPPKKTETVTKPGGGKVHVTLIAPTPQTPQEAAAQDLQAIEEEEAGPFGLAKSYGGVDTRIILIGGTAVAALLAVALISDD